MRALRGCLCSGALCDILDSQVLCFKGAAVWSGSSLAMQQCVSVMQGTLVACENLCMWNG